VSKRRTGLIAVAPSKHWIKVKNRQNPAMHRVMEAFS